MACPRCGEHCHCDSSRLRISQEVTYAGQDSFDDSEKQFVSSLGTSEAAEDEYQEIASATLGGASQRAQVPQLTPPGQQAAAGELSGAGPAWDSSCWRNEVSSRLQSYKARRRRRLGDDSLPLDFESTAGNHVFLQPDRTPTDVPPSEVEQEPSLDWRLHPPTSDAIAALSHCSAPERSALAMDYEPAALPSSAPEFGKLIEFPRPPVYPEYPLTSGHELADPVMAGPRILDVPEELPPAPLFDIRLEPAVEDHPPATGEFELPLNVASLLRRALAGAVDAFVVLLASALFSFVVLKTPAAALFAQPRCALMFAVFVPAGLWAAYIYLLLVYGAATPGMRLARLRLVRFDGGMPARQLRAFRSFVFLLSCFSLAFGLLWCFIDEDTLGWHDRATRTYLTGI